MSAYCNTPLKNCHTFVVSFAIMNYFSSSNLNQGKYGVSEWAESQRLCLAAHTLCGKKNLNCLHSF